MIDKSRVFFSRLSRRSMLVRGMVGAAALMTASVQSQAAKISQKAVSYQGSPHGDQRCGSCAQFQPPNACRSVEGAVKPSGWCRIWVKKG